MSIAHPRARCNYREIINDDKMLLLAMDYQIILAYELFDSDTAIPRKTERALHRLIENIRLSEKLRIQCYMIGDFLFNQDHDSDETGLLSRIKFAINRRKLVKSLLTIKE